MKSKIVPFDSRGVFADTSVLAIKDGRGCFIKSDLKNLRGFTVDGHSVADATGLMIKTEAFRPFREILVDLDPSQGTALATGVALVNWDKVTRYCGACGAETDFHEKDLAKLCLKCGQNSYPQIQPVVIVLITRGTDLLLARGLPPRKHHSCLAGFVEVGETVEETLHREVREEVGVEIENIRYFGSQPWPFPSNLMLGFVADYKSGEIKADPNEISHAAWFEKSSPPDVLPPNISIARQMIDSVWNPPGSCD